MSGQVFQVDTKGVCLLCISDSGIEAAPPPPPNSVSATGFKMFLRYLKIDIMDIGPPSSPLQPHLNGPQSVDISVVLCQRCSLVTSQFLELFQEFEKISLELDNCAQKLHGAIRDGQEDVNRVREYRKRLMPLGTSHHISSRDALNASIAERLREETLEKCALRLASSTTKVFTTKILAPLKYSPGPPTTLKSLLTNVQQVSTSTDFADNSVKEEMEDCGCLASPSPTVHEGPGPAVENSESVFDTEWDIVPPQQLLPPNPEIAKDAASAMVRAPSPKQAMAAPNAGISDDPVTHSNATTELRHPSCETIKLPVLPIFMPPGLPILAQAHSSNHSEFSQNQETQIMESLNKDSIIDMDFEGDSDNNNDFPIKDPLDLDSAPDPATVQSSTSSSRPSSHKYLAPIELPNGKLKCPLCGKIVGSRNTFLQHQRELHIRKYMFRCKHCHKMFPRNRALVKHVKIVHTFLEFRDRFPAGTTEIEFAEVVNDLVRQVKKGCAAAAMIHEGTPQRAISSNYCTFCEKVVGLCKGSWREHILYCHIELIVGNLEKGRHNWTSENINAQSVGSENRCETPVVESSLILKFEHEGV